MLPRTSPGGEFVPCAMGNRAGCCRVGSHLVLGMAALWLGRWLRAPKGWESGIWGLNPVSWRCSWLLVGLGAPAMPGHGQWDLPADGDRS